MLGNVEGVGQEDFHGPIIRAKKRTSQSEWRVMVECGFAAIAAHEKRQGMEKTMAGRVGMGLAAWAAAGALAWGPAAWAQGAPCAQPQWTAVSVDQATRIDRSLGAKELLALADRLGGHDADDERGAVLYETGFKVSASWTWGIEAVGAQSAFACVGALSYHSSLEPVLHIASEVPEGGCAEQAVVESEKLSHGQAVAEHASGVAAFASDNPWPTKAFEGSGRDAARGAAELYARDHVQRMAQSASMRYQMGAKRMAAEEPRMSQRCGVQSLGEIMDKALGR